VKSEPDVSRRKKEKKDVYIYVAYKKTNEVQFDGTIVKINKIVK